MTAPADDPRVLVRIEVKLDQALAQTSDHEARLRVLERSRWPLPAVGMLVSLGSLAVAVSALWR